MKSLNFKVELDLEFCRSGYNDTPPEVLEPDLNVAEIDIFMSEPFMNEKRYYWYAQSVAGFLLINVKGSENKIWDIQYTPGGKLSFKIELSGKNVDQQGFDLADNLREYGLGKEGGWSPYEGGIGNEFVVPSRKKYRDMEWEESLSDKEDESDDDKDYQTIGHIDFREDKRIRVIKID